VRPFLAIRQLFVRLSRGLNRFNSYMLKDCLFDNKRAIPAPSVKNRMAELTCRISKPKLLRMGDPIATPIDWPEKSPAAKAAIPVPRAWGAI